MPSVLALVAGCSSGTVVSPDGVSAFEVSVAAQANEAAIAWYGGPAPEGVYFERLSATGKRLSAPIRVSDPHRSGYEPDLKFAGATPLVAWYEKAADKSLTAWLAWLDRDGRLLRKVRLDGAGGWARNPVLRIDRGTVHAAWIETKGKDHPAIWYRQFDTQGRAEAPARRVGRASAHSWNLNAAVDTRGRFHIVYDSDLGTRASELRLLVIGGSSVVEQRLTPDDGAPSLYPDIGFGPRGEMALTWFDARDDNTEIYAAVLPAGMVRPTPIRRALRVTHTPAASIGAYLAWRGNGVTIVWSDAASGRYELYRARLDHAGYMLSAPEQLTHARDNAGIASLAPIGAGLLVGWNDYARGEGGHDAARASTAHVLRLD